MPSLVWKLHRLGVGKVQRSLVWSGRGQGGHWCRMQNDGSLPQRPPPSFHGISLEKAEYKEARSEVFTNLLKTFMPSLLSFCSQAHNQSNYHH
jgi:hypothetical protein